MINGNDVMEAAKQVALFSVAGLAILILILILSPGWYFMSKKNDKGVFAYWGGMLVLLLFVMGYMRAQENAQDRVRKQQNIQEVSDFLRYQQHKAEIDGCLKAKGLK